MTSQSTPIVPQSVLVRDATEEDRFGLFKLAAAMHAETDFKVLRFNPHKAIDGLGAWIHSPDGLMAIAVQGSEVVGMLAATKRAPWFTNDLMASEDLFFVRQDKRGGRTAFRLFQHFMAWATVHGAAHVRAGIATGDAGTNAGRLYEHFGFHKVGGSYSLFIGADKEQAA